MTEYVDVLVIGAGPAGLTAANCFNGSKLSVRVVDKKPGPIKTGRADGLKSITMEILDTFGIGDAIRNDCQRCEEIVLWDADSKGAIRRTLTIPDRVEELMQPREVTLDQGRIEYALIQNIEKHKSVDVRWGVYPVALNVDFAREDDPDAYPLTVTLNNESTGRQEIVYAKYVVGSDGAHSWLRKSLNIGFHGDLTDSTWGVLNLVPKTNFPDIRKVFVVHSTRGTIMGVPREDKMVRLYISMDGGSRHTSLDAKTITAENIMGAAKAILSPYIIEAGDIPWWSAYCVGQRVADEFSRYNRIFLAGDAVHTHSPKAGQGMNTSMQDGYNIGWKLRYCLEQKSDLSLLKTYEDERRPIAQALIDFDRDYLEFFARTDITHDEFLAAYLAAQKFTTGIGIQYPASLAVSDKRSTRASKLAQGKRLPDFQMVNQSDGVPIRAHHRFTCDGRFRILIFPGDISREAEASRFAALGEWFETHLDQLSGLEIITIHSSKRADVELMDLHHVFRPWDQDGGWNYWAVYADDESYHDGHGRVYERCGINESEGCLVVLRPDGYVSVIRDLNERDELVAFFDRLNSRSSLVKTIISGDANVRASL
ncbi:2-polyprenyl-6-methoxyphenol hydroxylase [Aureobasidium pullulans]|uniref:2-polyprenyl-6-methoxyphenol hydroxylase n=1 Tax=Aureobasidium pullulans TaxID=5580 RepID=A0A4S9AZ32_AURPU|nr:2-polyprenyl-6-methoxyphenol hydroxylase [Aureobasidium pullulans]